MGCPIALGGGTIMNKADELKIKILEILDSAENAHSYYELAKKIQSSFRTVKSASEFLERLGLVAIERKDSSAIRFGNCCLTPHGGIRLRSPILRKASQTPQIMLAVHCARNHFLNQPGDVLSALMNSFKTISRRWPKKNEKHYKRL